MHGVSIRYEFTGDEAKWEAAVAAFISAIDQDKDLAGRFHYRVNKAKEGNTRVHWGRWDRPETVRTLQSRDYFTTFIAQLKDMANGTLSPVPLTEHLSTGA